MELSWTSSDLGQRLEQWVRDGEAVLRLLPELFGECEHWRERAEAGERRAAALARELEHVRREQAAMADSVQECLVKIGRLTADTLIDLRKRV